MIYVLSSFCGIVFVYFLSVLVCSGYVNKEYIKSHLSLQECRRRGWGKHRRRFAISYEYLRGPWTVFEDSNFSARRGIYILIVAVTFIISISGGMFGYLVGMWFRFESLWGISVVFALISGSTYLGLVSAVASILLLSQTR